MTVADWFVFVLLAAVWLWMVWQFRHGNQVLVPKVDAARLAKVTARIEAFANGMRRAGISAAKAQAAFEAFGRAWNDAACRIRAEHDRRADLDAERGV